MFHSRAPQRIVPKEVSGVRGGAIGDRFPLASTEFVMMG